MKKLVQLVIMLCSMFIMTVSAFAAESLIDNARLLNAQDRIAVQNALRQVENTYGVRAAVVTIKDNRIGDDIGQYANVVLDKNYTNGRNGNMVLVVNMANRKWYISTDKNMGKKITKEYGVRHLGNQTAARLKNGNYKDAFVTYAKVAGEELAYYKQNGRAMTAPKGTTTAPKKKGSNLPMAGGGALLAGILGALGYGSSLKKSMSNVAFATRADQYMKDGSFNLKEKDDTFMYITVTRTPKSKPEDRRDNEDNYVNDDYDASDDDHDGAGGDF